MLPATEMVFWICLVIILYTYAGYPLLLQVLVLFKGLFSKNRKHNNIYIPVTLVVAAYNEEDIIEQKINNCLALDYPRDFIRFVFVTDGSNDHTPTIIKKYPDITHYHENERRGKLAAVNRAMQFIDTDILIFSDANTMLNRESITRLVQHYSNKKVGAVAGELRLTASGCHALARGEHLYWKYESWIK